VTAFGQSSSLQGTVTDDSGEPVMFATVKLEKDGSLITGTQTDFDGKYSFSNIDAGTYDLAVSYVGYQTKKTADVVVFEGKSLTLNIEISAGINLTEVVVTYEVPLIEQDNTSSGAVVTSKEIAKLGSKSITGIITQAAGVSTNSDGQLTIRGSRTNGTDYYIDGIRVSGSMIPQSEIEQIKVITGGLPASIGDVTGGIVSITTKGPSSKFNGTAELETSEFLDGYGYNLGMLSLSGPILRAKNKKGERKGESIIGFRFSGQYRSRRDRDPSAVGIYKVKDDVYDELVENPLIRFNTGNEVSLLPAANFLTADDIELVTARPNAADVRYDATGKIDVRLSKNMDIAIGGSFNTRQSQPSTNSVFNYNRNRTDSDTDYRGFFRFRHRIGGATMATDKEENSNNTSIQNASYTLQFSYDYNTRTRQDPIHEDNLLNYGYIGDFTHSENPITGDITSGPLQGTTGHTANFYRLDNYAASDVNAPLANYNKLVDDFSQISDFPFFNGNRLAPAVSVNGLHTNVNEVFDRYDVRENHRYQFNAKGLFEIIPRGNAKGKHTIEFGLMYEQRVERNYRIDPRNLWQIGRQLVNNHFNGLDYTDSIGIITQGGLTTARYANLAQDDIWAAIDPANRTSGQAYFDKQLRSALGAGRKEWIDIDGLTPDQLKLEYFSADELLNNPDFIEYNGYDHLGNKIGGDASFNDFFTEKNGAGEYTRRIAPNQPLYTAAYVEDKFLFKDIIFRIGLRVDRYDPNTKTLKDPFVLYDAFTAGDHADPTPGSVSNDAVVYTSNGELGGNVRAYRDGATWYTADGTEVNNPITIFGAEQAQPALVNDNENIQDASFDPNSTFVDADPSVTFMPRLAFSFPISEDAGFFAHYDVLAQRPGAGVALQTPADYYFFERAVQRSERFNNPSLRPEKTIDYEVGFQQKLSEKSAIKMSIYYKELRDMIQTQTYFYAFPLTYNGYGNQDFGTVKGFNFSYDLRRTGNVTLRASYTLQFAEGTGSDANSQSDLTNSNTGNLRVIFPLDFDERHRLTATIDYRYGEGKVYNGPTINGKQIFANTGINLTAIAASGTPYTATTLPTVYSANSPTGGENTRGGVNGARLPFTSTLNLRIDKDFTLVSPTKDKKGMYLNVYFRVQNLLDQRNIDRVYSATGSPDDDGWIASPRGQSDLKQRIDPASYLLSYQWATLNPGFYALPRRIFLGAVVNF
jgi:outer membrane receptor protein involved in Fe transport